MAGGEAGPRRVAGLGRSKCQGEAGANFWRTRYAAKMESKSKRDAGQTRWSRVVLLLGVERSDGTGARSGGLIGIKAGPNNRSRIRCRKLRWGRAKGVRGRGEEREKARWRGQEEDEQRQESEGMGGEDLGYERRPGHAAAASAAGIGQASVRSVQKIEARTETLAAMRNNRERCAPCLMLHARVLDAIVSFML